VLSVSQSGWSEGGSGETWQSAGPDPQALRLRLPEALKHRERNGSWAKACWTLRWLVGASALSREGS